MVMQIKLIVVVANESGDPGQKVLGHLLFFTCFCMEFTANLRYTLINKALTRFLPHPTLPWTKLRSLAYAKYVKSVWLVTTNTVQGGGGSTWITFSSPETQSVSNVLTRIIVTYKSSVNRGIGVVALPSVVFYIAVRTVQGLIVPQPALAWLRHQSRRLSQGRDPRPQHPQVTEASLGAPQEVLSYFASLVRLLYLLVFV